VEDTPKQQGLKPLKVMPSVPTVNVPEMDAEHKACEEAYNKLIKSRSRIALQELYAVLQSHFQHEEAMLDGGLYKDVQHTTGFSADASARRSHYADHMRLLDELQVVLDRGEEHVSEDFIANAAASFHSHASVYDNHYATRIASGA